MTQMLLTTLSGKYKIGDTIVVNVGDRSVLVNSQPVRLRRQVFSALLLLMEQRLHEAAVPYDDFSKTLAEDKRLRGDVISNESIRGIVMELNRKLQPHLIASVPGIGYKLDAEITPLEPRNSAIPPVAISEFSQITERLNSVIDNIPELIETSIMLALSGNFSDITDDQLDQTVFCDTDITDDNWHVPQTLPVVPPTPISLQSKVRDTFNIGDVVLRHWKIVRHIGIGSYSTVYEAHRTVDNVICKSAIKIIHSSLRSVPIVGTNGLDTQTVNSACLIQHELAHMIALKGTGYIVSYEDHDIVELPDGSMDTIIRMELLEPLSNVLNSKHFTEEEVIKLGVDICKALELCADINLIHRDIKPSNIFITQWGGYKLGDFSAATMVGEQLEINQIGTLRYMAPEVYHGKTFSANIDTYSLGLVMYELLNGKEIPFLCRDDTHRGCSTKQEALARRLSGKPLPEIPGVSSSLQSAILKACAFDPTKRFQSPLEMRKVLETLYSKSGKPRPAASMMRPLTGSWCGTRFRPFLSDQNGQRQDDTGSDMDINNYATEQDLSRSDGTVYTWCPEWRVEDITCFSVSFGDLPIRNISYDGCTLTFRNKINGSRDGWMTFPPGYFDPVTVKLSAEDHRQLFRCMAAISREQWSSDPRWMEKDIPGADGFVGLPCFSCEFKNGTKFKYLPGRNSAPGFTALCSFLSERIPSKVGGR